MARDRKRAKQRRRERRGEADVVPSPDPITGAMPPNPIAGATPDVDQAKLAEAGVARGESGDVEFDRDEHADADAAAANYEPAPDEIEGDQPIRRSDLDPSVAEETFAQPSKPRPRVIAFLGHCVDELRRVQWPNRKQVFQATAVVLGFVVLAGGYLGLMDAIFKPLVQAIL